MSILYIIHQQQQSCIIKSEFKGGTFKVKPPHCSPEFWPILHDYYNPYAPMESNEGQVRGRRSGQHRQTGTVSPRRISEFGE